MRVVQVCDPLAEGGLVAQSPDTHRLAAQSPDRHHKEVDGTVIDSIVTMVLFLKNASVSSLDGSPSSLSGVILS